MDTDWEKVDARARDIEAGVLALENELDVHRCNGDEDCPSPLSHRSLQISVEMGALILARFRGDKPLVEDDRKRMDALEARLINVEKRMALGELPLRVSGEKAVVCPHESRGRNGHIHACLDCGDPTRVVCPRCGQEVSLYADGNLWQHGTQASSSPLGGRDDGCEGSLMFPRGGELISRREHEGL